MPNKKWAKNAVVSAVVTGGIAVSVLPTCLSKVAAEEVPTTTVTKNVVDNGDDTTITTTITTTTKKGDPVVVRESVKETDDDYNTPKIDDDGNTVVDENGDPIHPTTRITTSTDTTVTTKTDTVTTRQATKMTNADTFDGKTVYVLNCDGTVAKAGNEAANAAKKFLTATNPASDFAVYADTLANTIGHEDGYIAVNKVNASTTVMVKDGQYASGAGNTADKAYALNGFSYIGSLGDNVYISSCSNQRTGNTNDALLIVGDASVLDKTDATGEANHFTGKTIEDAKSSGESRVADLDTKIAINDNLSAMANTGNGLISKVQATENGLNSTVSALENGNYDSGSIITVTLPASVLEGNDVDQNAVNQALAKLVTSNKTHVYVVVNVDTTGEGNTLNIPTMMNGVRNYSADANYLIWNFGSYDGVINLGYYSGVVIAPNADLRAGQLESGRAVGKIVSHSGEIHTAVSGEIHKGVSEVVNQDSKTDSKTTTDKSVSYEYPEVTVKPSEAPAPTSTPEATPTAKPTSTSSAEPTTTVTPTAEPTVEPTPSAKPTEEPVVTPETTPEPTETPKTNTKKLVIDARIPAKINKEKLPNKIDVTIQGDDSESNKTEDTLEKKKNYTDVVTVPKTDDNGEEINYTIKPSESSKDAVKSVETKDNGFVITVKVPDTSDSIATPTAEATSTPEAKPSATSIVTPKSNSKAAAVTTKRVPTGVSSSDVIAAGISFAAALLVIVIVAITYRKKKH